MEVQEIKDRLDAGVELMEMPGSTFSKTWEVQSVHKDKVVVKLVDQAVGYDYATESDEDLTDEYTYERLSELLVADNDKGGWIINQ